MSPSRSLAVLALAIALPGATPAADERPSLVADAAVGPIRQPIREERPFAFVIDPTSPRGGMTGFEYRVGFASGLVADRPLPADLTSAGGSHSFTVSHGLTGRIAPYATATLFDEGKRANVLAGARVQITDPASPFRLAVLAAGLREAAGDYGLQVTAATSYDAGPLRLAANVQAEKVFAGGRDALDVLVMAGTTMRVARFLRVGAEYVGQDLEGAIERDEAEGGARHMVGPSVAFDLEGGRYQLAVAGGFGLTPQTPDFLVRAQLALNF